MSYIKKLRLLFNTVRYLKPIQIRYRLKYFIKNRFGKKNSFEPVTTVSIDNLSILKFQQSIYNAETFKSGNSFTFLNLNHTFSNGIDWDFPNYGRLWTYNLNYFEYLNQKDISVNEGLKLIDEYIKTIDNNTTGQEPYPISLRVMNWIRFFITHGINDLSYNGYLLAQLQLLRDLKEYHLLGNHLLENGFAFLFGSYYFNDASLYKEAKSILVPELIEQILRDGAHFELSPMYHNLMTNRVLDCYNLVSNNNLFDKELLSLLKEKAEVMLGFIKKITYRNGDIPLMNDAAFGVAPTSKELLEYAKRLGLHIRENELSDSGYRKFESDNYELVFDIGEVGPTYQPGHTHADTLSFELHINNRPIIIDTGTSTYEVNDIRFYERSTRAHNTVTINGENSSEIWAGHRVGRRANVQVLVDEPNHVKARHDGYNKHFGVDHTREIIAMISGVIIKDDLNGKTGVAHLHFAPNEVFEIVGNEVIGNDYKIVFTNHQSIEKINTYYSPEFNKRVECVSLNISFAGKLTTQIMSY